MQRQRLGYDKVARRQNGRHSDGKLQLKREKEEKRHYGSRRKTGAD